MVYAAVRVRGTVNIKPNIKRTLQLLHLTRANHCVILEENDTYKGMLRVAKDYLTWGEIEKDVLIKLIKSRGRLKGDISLTDEYIKSATSFDNIENLSKGILDDKIKYKDVPKVKTIFRLNPPHNGYKSIKRYFDRGGTLGYRGKKINKLISRMI